MQETLSERQAISILVMFTLGTVTISGVGKSAQENAWIAILLAAIVSVPIYLMYAQLLKIFKNKNLFQICEAVFGIYIGKVLSLIMIWHGVFLGSILLRIVSEFMAVAGLDQTPLMFISLLIAVTNIYMIKSGIGIFGKWCQFYFFIVLVVFLSEGIFLFPARNLKILYPILYNGTSPVVESTLYIIALPMTQATLLMSYFNKLDSKGSYRKVFLYGLLISTIIMLMITIDNITVLGPEVFANSYFPSYSTFRRISFGSFLRRAEIFTVLVCMVLGLVKITSCMFTTLIGFQSLFNLKTYKALVVPITLLSSMFAFLAYDDILEFEINAIKIYIPFALATNIAIPVLLFLTYNIKNYFSKNHKK